MSDTTMETAVQTALRTVAQREGVSVERVRREIDIAVATARQNDDPAVASLWKAMLAKDADGLSAESIVAHFARLHMDGEDKI